MDVLADKRVVHNGLAVPLENFLKLPDIIRLVGARKGKASGQMLERGEVQRFTPSMHHKHQAVSELKRNIVSDSLETHAITGMVTLFVSRRKRKEKQDAA